MASRRRKTQKQQHVGANWAEYMMRVAEQDKSASVHPVKEQFGSTDLTYVTPRKGFEISVIPEDDGVDEEAQSRGSDPGGEQKDSEILCTNVPGNDREQQQESDTCERSEDVIKHDRREIGKDREIKGIKLNDRRSKERASRTDSTRVCRVSVLIDALRSVHEWIRQGRLTILVPAQSDSTAPPSSSQDRRTRPGLFIQAQDEHCAPARVGELRTRREAEEELEALINDLEADTGHPIDRDVFQLDMPERESDGEDEVILIQTPAAQHARSSSEERKKVARLQDTSAM
ncbi:hypothetical protein OC861_002033 [Tilletia horrida]|nr:hypothetical protein OC861_002033 [Tilletia horrida]